MRKCLRVILAAGFSPMSFFARDHAKYFNLAELLSLVDLSLVRGLGAGGRAGGMGVGGMGDGGGVGAAQGGCQHVGCEGAADALLVGRALHLLLGGLPADAGGAGPLPHLRAPPRADREAGRAVQPVGRQRDQPGHRAPPPQVL